MINCSFCGKNENELRSLITGPDVYICNECVSLCAGIIFDQFKKEAKMCERNLKTAEEKDNIVEIIATGIYEYIKMTSNDPSKTYLPAAKEEVIKKYQNDPFFHRTVDCIAFGIIDLLISRP